MAKYAIIEDTGDEQIVRNVIILEESEYENYLGHEFLIKSFDDLDVNTNPRKNPAYIGGFYHKDSDTFSPPKPFKSWVLNNDMQWIPPVEKPNDNDNEYGWDEDTLSWVEYNPNAQ